MKSILFSGCLAILLLAGCNNDKPDSAMVAGALTTPDTEFAGVTMTENEDLKSGASTFDENENDPNSCGEVLTTVFQKLSVHSHKEYLQKLSYLYEATSQQDLESRKGSALGIDVPDYGSLSWGSNKTKVNTLTSKYKSQGTFTLSTDELLKLSQVYTRSADVLSAHDKWLGCIEVTNGIPRLREQLNSDSEVIVYFKMKPNAYRDGSDRVKVRNVNYSGNLVITKGDLTGKKITYNGDYTLTFKRKNGQKATVSVDLEEGSILPVDIGAVTKEPVMVMETVKNSYQCNVEINVSANWMKIKSPGGAEQRVTFANQSRNPYKLRFNVNTKLKNPQAKILDCFYTPASGGIGDFRMKGVKLNGNNTLSVDCYMVTGGKRMKGKFTILYSETKEVCKANCPD